VTDFIDITLVANAGVLVEHAGRGLPVDGIHHQDRHPFSKVAEADLERMKERSAPFANFKYLLFSHEHPDHFTPGRVQELVQPDRTKGLFLPDEPNAQKQPFLEEKDHNFKRF